MGTVIHKTTYEYKTSVHTPDYPSGTWLHNPDVSGLSSVDQKYWKVDGSTVVEMSQAEKDVVDAAVEDAEDDALETAAVDKMIVKNAHCACSTVQTWLANNPVITDSESSTKGPPCLMQMWKNQREIFGDSANPLGSNSDNLRSRVDDLEDLARTINTVTTTTYVEDGTAIATIAVPESSVIVIDLTVVARRNSANRAAYGYKIVAFRETGDATVYHTYTVFIRETASYWNVWAVASGNNVEIRVRGVNFETINWKSAHQILTV